MKKGAYFFLSLLLLFCLCSASSKKQMLSPELKEALFSDATIASKRILIPGYQTVLNPSLISYADGYLLSFRLRKGAEKAKNFGRVDMAFIGTAKLNRKFEVLPESVSLLDILSHSEEFSRTAEDARLIQIGERIFIFFNDIPSLEKKKGFALYFAELIEKDGKFFTNGPAKLLKYSKSIGIEKNWSPFVADGKCYVIYSDEPRIILSVDLKSGECTEVASDSSSLDWKWGRVRGGTPAYSLGEQFVTFFHSSFPITVTKKGKEKQRPVYVMGMYLFDTKFPFSIRSVFPLPLGTVSDYSKENSRQVVFPCGLVVEKDVFHVAWGKNNRQIWITTFDQNKLLKKNLGDRI